MSWPTPSPLFRMQSCFCVLALWSSAAAQGGAPTLTVVQAAGRAERQVEGGLWEVLRQQRDVSYGLRTGAGRVTLRDAAGNRVTVGSASRLRIYQQEPDFQEGQFLYEGGGGFFALGWHMSMETRGRARIDLNGTGAPRLAVLAGRVRLSSGPRTLLLNAGEQITLLQAQVTPFAESDPWYLAQFVGPGAATVEALRGKVQHRSGGVLRMAERGRALEAGDSVTTAANAWVEIGFSGGGYLRLTEQSELSVVAIEKTSRGREVMLRLIRGSAWNVVEKGQGGYRITTPVVSTAVRGTAFRVDADGTVKVFDGEVELPSSPGVMLRQGEQKEVGQPVESLQPDALDRLNMQLDAERERPLTLSVQDGQGRLSQPGQRWARPDLNLEVRSLPDTLVTAQLAGQPVTVSAQPETGLYQLQTPNPLPEGPVSLVVTARRFGQMRQQRVQLLIDRTPPVLGTLQAAREGNVLVITGTLEDSASQRVTLELRSGQTEVIRQLPPGPFRLVLPAPSFSAPLQISARDAAGHVIHATLP